MRIGSTKKKRSSASGGWVTYVGYDSEDEEPPADIAVAEWTRSKKVVECPWVKESDRKTFTSGHTTSTSLKPITYLICSYKRSKFHYIMIIGYRLLKSSRTKGSASGFTFAPYKWLQDIAKGDTIGYRTRPNRVRKESSYEDKIYIRSHRWNPPDKWWERQRKESDGERRVLADTIGHNDPGVPHAQCWKRRKQKGTGKKTSLDTHSTNRLILWTMSTNNKIWGAYGEEYKTNDRYDAIESKADALPSPWEKLRRTKLEIWHWHYCELSRHLTFYTSSLQNEKVTRCFW